MQEDIVLRFQAFCGVFSIINVLCFLKIFRYLDNIVIKHNKILDLVGFSMHGKNKYNCFVLWTRSFLCLGFGEAFDPSPLVL